VDAHAYGTLTETLPTVPPAHTSPLERPAPTRIPDAVRATGPEGPRCMVIPFTICSPSVLDPWEPEIEALAAAGKAKGYLTYEEMNTAAPELAPSPEMMDRILQAMDVLRMEIIDGGDAVRRERAASRARGEVEPVVPEKDRKPSALELPITTEKIDDPVRMYLTQMGEIPLLTRDQEISLAKKIEITRKRYRHAVLDSGIAIAECIRIL
jgi:hypothetical protein